MMATIATCVECMIPDMLGMAVVEQLFETLTAVNQLLQVSLALRR